MRESQKPKPKSIDPFVIHIPPPPLFFSKMAKQFVVSMVLLLLLHGNSCSGSSGESALFRLRTRRALELVRTLLLPTVSNVKFQTRRHEVRLTDSQS